MSDDKTHQVGLAEPPGDGAPSPGCNCIENIDNSLSRQDYNKRRFKRPYFLEVVWYLHGRVSMPAIFYGGMNSKDTFVRVGRVRANFCPFCGQRYVFPPNEGTEPL